MDYQYWNNYYNKNMAPKEPSKFAKDILSKLEKGKSLVELGCGNGRDSIYFASNEVDVTAIDQSDNVIENLESKKIYKNIKFVSADFVNSGFLTENTYDYVYSRFTMHSISDKDQSVVLKKAYNTLKNEGLLFIEARSIKDEICGLGENVGRNAYVYNNHYRRFIVMTEMIEELEKIGFKIISSKESDKCAIYKDENPVVVRIVAQK